MDNPGNEDTIINKSLTKKKLREIMPFPYLDNEDSKEEQLMNKTFFKKKGGNINKVPNKQKIVINQLNSFRYM